MADERKRYLGDGAYIEDQGYHLVLTTENGISVQNTIYLNPEVSEALLRYLTKLKEERAGK